LVIIAAVSSSVMARQLKIYTLTTDHQGVIFLAGSKKKAFEFLRSSKAFRPKTIYNYWNFSQAARWQKPFKINCETCVVTMDLHYLNEPILTDQNLFSW